MKIRIVKKPDSPYKISNYSVETNVTKHDWYFKKDDTIEIDLSEITNWSREHWIETDGNYDGIRILMERFFKFKMEGK
jgi:hypothetical protein